MGLFGKTTPEKAAARTERAVATEQHRAYRAASANSRKHFKDENAATNAINSAVIDAERDVSWWRR